MASLAVELVFSPDWQRRVALSDAALAMARRLGDPATLAEVLGGRYYAILSPSNLEERLTNTAELVEVARALDDPVIRNRASWFRCRAAIESGDLDEAEFHLGQVQHFTELLRQPWLRWARGFARTGLTLLQGRLDEAEALAHETVELGRAAGDPEASFVFALERFLICRDRGVPQEAEHCLATVGKEGTPAYLFESMQALLDCELGRHDRPRPRLDRLAGERFARLPINNTWLMTLTNWATVAATLREPEAAGVLCEILSPYGGQVPLFAGAANGVVSFYLGMLEAVRLRFDEAEAHFAVATERHDRMPAPVWLARTRLEWAGMLLTRRQTGDADRGRELLDHALATARELGLGGVERQAVALL
ncbi:MAG: hypothetical protein LC792_14385, partial [Actinobacteria bacterium]|nr:hypothetical protein [Actinomycetota bacterium]